MSNQGKAIVVAACVVAVLLPVALLIQHEPEPGYQGRTLSQWLRTPPAVSSPFDFAVSAEGRQAIHKMGTNAIRVALRWIAYEPSVSRQQAGALARWIPARLRPRFVQHQYNLALDAERVFFILGSEARPAIPQLARLARTSRGEARVGRCARALFAIGPEALPAMITIIENPGGTDRGYVIDCIEDFGPEASRAIPSLLKALGDPDTCVVGAAARALGCLSLSNSIVVPALVSNLRSTNLFHRCIAAYALRRLGPAAKAAIPALQNALQDTNTDVSEEAAWALNAIERDMPIEPPPP